MQKISDSTNTANPVGEFTEGNPAAGVPATLLKAPWLNAVQRELVALVLGAGINLNASDDSQVLKAVKALAGVAADFNKLTNKPTTLGGYGITDAFTKPETAAAIQQAIAALVASSPAALDTLKELADALGNDPNFATTMTNALASKASKATTLGGYGITDAYTKTQVDTSLAGKANKATTLAGYGITDALVVGSGGWLASGPGVSGTITGIPVSQLFSGISPGTTDAPQSAPNSVGLHLIFANTQFGADIAVAVNDIQGQLLFRGLGPTAGLGVWRSAWHDGNFTPASKISGNSCPDAGFAGGDVAVPYMKHTNNTVVPLATVAASFGIGQNYVNRTGARVSGLTYPNSTGKRITVTVNMTSGVGGSVASATVAANAGVKTIGQGSGTTNFSLSFDVPAGATYSFNTGSAAITSVWEITS